MTYCVQLYQVVSKGITFPYELCPSHHLYTTLAAKKCHKGAVALARVKTDQAPPRRPPRQLRDTDQGSIDLK